MEHHYKTRRTEIIVGIYFVTIEAEVTVELQQ
jgi:hypothetical protein